MKLLNAQTRSVLDFHVAIVPPGKSMADEIDRMQRRVLSVANRVPRHPDEELPAIVRCEGRKAGACEHE